MQRITTSLLLAVAIVATIVSARNQAQVNTQNLLTRWYEVGERISYKVTGTTTDRSGTTSYSATVSGVVKKDEMDRFFEELAWSQFASNGTPVQIPAANQAFRQILSLAPDRKSTAPNTAQIFPRIVDPAFDLLSIYTDAAAAMQQGALRSDGDRGVVFNHGDTVSWADGMRILIGEDSTDLEITLDEVSLLDGSAKVTVHHVAPGVSKIKTPAEWMKGAVADTSNNWVQVVRAGARQFVASVGQETAEVHLELSLTNGKIFSAEMDTHIEVLERECTDEALTMCREGVRHQIVRHVKL